MMYQHKFPPKLKPKHKFKAKKAEIPAPKGNAMKGGKDYSMSYGKSRKKMGNPHY